MCNYIADCSFDFLLQKGSELINEDLKHMKKKAKFTSFMSGDAGTLALGAWYYNKTGMTDKCAMCINQ